MYFYSKKSHRKIIHMESCPFRKRLDPQSTGIFGSLQEASAAGYCLCRKCNPLIRLYQKDTDAIMEYSQKHGIACWCEDRYLHITSTISQWVLTLLDENMTILYHKNSRSTIRDNQSYIAGYHNQGVAYNSMMEYLKYIKRHDDYRMDHPERPDPQSAKKAPAKGTKRWRAAQKKAANRARRQEIQRVWDLIDSLSAANHSYAG